MLLIDPLCKVTKDFMYDTHVHVLYTVHVGAVYVLYAFLTYNYFIINILNLVI